MTIQSYVLLFNEQKTKTSCHSIVESKLNKLEVSQKYICIFYISEIRPNA